MQNLFEIEKGIRNLNELQNFIDNELGGLENLKAILGRLQQFDQAIVRAGGVKEFIKSLQMKPQP